uniref:Uncharacterized protein n=1 Tax=Arundo donax TaxID=35708 RepID=A0A0A8ZNW5_ARUDO
MKSCRGADVCDPGSGGGEKQAGQCGGDGEEVEGQACTIGGWAVGGGTR